MRGYSSARRGTSPQIEVDALAQCYNQSQIKGREKSCEAVLAIPSRRAQNDRDAAYSIRIGKKPGIIGFCAGSRQDRDRNDTDHSGDRILRRQGRLLQTGRPDRRADAIQQLRPGPASDGRGQRRCRRYRGPGEHHRVDPRPSVDRTFPHDLQHAEPSRRAHHGDAGFTDQNPRRSQREEARLPRSRYGAGHVSWCASEENEDP